MRSVLFAAVRMIVLFLSALEQVEGAGLVIVLFSACLLTLIASLSALKLALYGERHDVWSRRSPARSAIESVRAPTH